MAALADVMIESTSAVQATPRLEPAPTNLELRHELGTPPELPAIIPSLDGLRAVSIVLVFLAHVAGTTHAPAFLDKLVPVGNLGVKVFFVISGFLITTLLVRERAETGTVSLRNFYIRRAIRIFPAFYAYIAVLVALHLGGLIPLTVRDVVHALTYTANYNAHSMSTAFDTAQASREWYVNHLWSLSVEEQFYLLWPLAFVLVGPRRGTWVVAMTVLVVPFVRLAMGAFFDLPAAAYTRQFQAVADALATGCLLALAYNWLGRCRWYVKLLASPAFVPLAIVGIVAALALYKVNEKAYYIVGQTLVNLILGVTIDRFVRFPNSSLGRMLNLKPVRFVGVLSYSLYLWQEPFLNSFESSFVTTFPQNIGFAVAAGLASHYLVEKPFMRFRRYFTHARS